MRRNEETTIDRLQVGDRFYKKADKGVKKEVFEVMDTETQIRTKSQKHFICPDAFVGGMSETQKTVPISGNTPVIFLRHAPNDAERHRYYLESKSKPYH